MPSPDYATREYWDGRYEESLRPDAPPERYGTPKSHMSPRSD
jgi:hypothetical protein